MNLNIPLYILINIYTSKVNFHTASKREGLILAANYSLNILAEDKMKLFHDNNSLSDKRGIRVS